MRSSGIGRRARYGSAVAIAACLALAASGAVDGRGGERRVERFDTVVIDAGHGGEDAGARGAGGVVEKNLVLDLARRLANELAERELSVVLTRSDDSFVPLERRTAIANDARGDLFVSIHANASTDRSVHGSETYFLSLDATDSDASRVAERENRAFPASADPRTAVSDPLVAIMGDMLANEHSRESSLFAHTAQKHLGRIEAQRSRGVKQAPFVVLMGVQMPASLVEIGFVSHRDEERQLASGTGRARIVSALADAVVAFGDQYDRRRGNR